MARIHPTAALLAALALARPAAAQDTISAPRSPLPDSVVVDSAGPRVCAGGDVTLSTNLDTTWVFGASRKLGWRVPALPSPDSLLAPLKPLLSDADVVLLNVESAIGAGPPARRKCAPGSTSCFAFRAPPAAAGALRRVADSAQVVGNVANNHARDAGIPGWYGTMRHLRDAGVHVTGGDTVPTLVETADGDTIAFLGYSPWTGPDPRRLAEVRRVVRRAAERYPFVVVSMHMGAEGRGAQRTPNATEIAFGEDRGNSVAFAHTAVEAGADVVFGHGPHVMRAAEWYRDGLIFYSLGNLVTYGPFTLSDPLNRGAIACVELDRAGGVRSAVLRSTRQRAPGLVSVDSTGRAATMVEELSALDFPRAELRVADTGEILRAGDAVPEGRPSVTSPRRRK